MPYVWSSWSLGRTGRPLPSCLLNDNSRSGRQNVCSACESMLITSLRSSLPHTHLSLSLWPLSSSPTLSPPPVTLPFVGGPHCAKPATVTKLQPRQSFFFFLSLMQQAQHWLYRVHGRMFVLLRHDQDGPLLLSFPGWFSKLASNMTGNLEWIFFFTRNQ